MSDTPTNLEDVVNRIPRTEEIEIELYRISRMLGLLIQNMSPRMLGEPRLLKELREILE